MISNSDIQKKFNEIISIKNEKEKIDLMASIIHLNIMDEISQLMEEKSINKKRLSEELNVSKSYISQLFTADKIINLRQIAQIQNIFDVKFGVTFHKDYMAIVSSEFRSLISDIAKKENVSTNELTQNMLEQGIALKTYNKLYSIASATKNIYPDNDTLDKSEPDKNCFLSTSCYNNEALTA